MYRWHNKDPVYFDKSFRMTIDDGIYAPPIHAPRYDDFTSVAFYYLTEPKPLPFELPSHFELFMREDVFKMKLTIPDHTEEAAYGAAVFGAEAILAY